jgi:hypothetical protein
MRCAGCEAGSRRRVNNGKSHTLKGEGYLGKLGAMEVLKQNLKMRCGQERPLMGFCIRGSESSGSIKGEK